MILRNSLRRFSELNRFIVRSTSHLIIWVLAAMMFLTFFDVVLRYTFNSPVQGSSELIEFMMAILIPFSIVFCAHEKEHVAVKLIVERFSDFTGKIIECLTRFIMLLLFILITWQSILFAMDQYQRIITSAVLYIPVYPFAILFAAAFLILSFVLISQFLTTLIEVISQWNRLPSE